MKVTRQSPDPRLEVYDLESDQPFLIYVAKKTGKGPESTALQSYTFSQSVYDIIGTFSFSVELDEFGSGSDRESVFEKVKIRNVVKIYEGGDNPVFIGIIRKKRFANAMSSSGVQRNITFSGNSILSCINDLVISLDPKIMDVPDAETETEKLTMDLVDITTALDFMKQVYDRFTGFKVAGKAIMNSAMQKAIEKFCNGIGSVLTSDKDITLYYNIACAFFNQGENRIVDVWKMILPEPVYEMFGYCDRQGQPRIQVREVPFSDGWGSLTKTKILYELLISYELSKSDEEVYTFFNSYLEGMALNPDQYATLAAYDGKNPTIVSTDKVDIYGYRPLEVRFRGFDRKQNLEEDKLNGIQEEIKAFNEKVSGWYGNLDELATGSIQMVNVYGRDVPLPGERVEFAGGEFYVTGCEHTWHYGNTPTITLSVSRGTGFSLEGKFELEE
ncbi:hypothetical protein FACS1894172_15220 [Spirochaetia bacterium]|nr:hypothetical protein FACS1894164_04090 [Spirochaetia bacterium]GHU34649.1 hypothetical protein FACS1894172_15220 [Spirochaetia bacterium]